MGCLCGGVGGALINKYKYMYSTEPSSKTPPGALEYGAIIYENESGWRMLFDPERGGWIIEKGLKPNQSWIGSGSNANPPINVEFKIEEGGTGDWTDVGTGTAVTPVTTGETELDIQK